jgi:hypothetical protein
MVAHGTLPGNSGGYGSSSSHSSTGGTDHATSTSSTVHQQGTSSQSDGELLHGEASSTGAGVSNSRLLQEDFSKFVRFFRVASPYIEGHRGKLFCFVIPGNVSESPPLVLHAWGMYQGPACSPSPGSTRMGMALSSTRRYAWTATCSPRSSVT